MEVKIIPVHGKYTNQVKNNTVPSFKVSGSTEKIFSQIYAIRPSVEISLVFKFITIGTESVQVLCRCWCLLLFIIGASA
jgi:hypothetical protein